MQKSRNITRTPLIKRILDLVLSSIALILLSPVMILTSIAILLTDGFPILFTQPRPGFKGKVFNNYKFRTMRTATDERGNLLPEEKRLFPLGKFLRRISLDELPELFNILRGEMSLVGPRPLLVEYLPLYSPQQARRHEVLPGLTGWAQVNGRNALTWEDKFKLDVWYVDHWSFGLDLKIIFMTIGKVLRGEGISPAAGEIMEKFTGSRKNR
jgi:lipopolysaccharide/colanic/teichoic acid biosynthesis glycosyltransferase